MPYISSEYRDRCNKIIDQMKLSEIKANGELNYILFKFCKDSITPSYNNYKNYIGELRQCASEIERRILSPYEDQKIIDNGDV